MGGQYVEKEVAASIEQTLRPILVAGPYCIREDGKFVECTLAPKAPPEPEPGHKPEPKQSRSR